MNSRTRGSLALALLALILPLARPAFPAPASNPALFARIQDDIRRGSDSFSARPDIATAAFKHAYVLAHGAGLDSLEAWTLVQIGRLEARRDVGRARLILDSSLPLWRAHGDSVGVARTLAALADLERQRGNLRGALDGLGYAARIAGNSSAAARILLGAASLDAELDDPDRYLKDLEQAVARARAARDTALASRVLAQRSRALAALGSPRQARLILEEALPGAHDSQAELLLALAGLEASAEQFDKGDAALERVRKISDPARPPRLLLAQSAGIRWMRGDLVGASGLYEEARAAAHAAGDPELEWLAMSALGRLGMQTHQSGTARLWGQRLLAETQPGSRSAIEGQLLRGLGYLSEGRLAEARRDLSAARGSATVWSESGLESACDQGLGDADALESQAESAFRWYARATEAAGRAEAELWRQAAPAAPPWTSRAGLLRRRLNLALLDGSPRRGWVLNEEAMTSELLDALTGSPAARLLRRDPRERDAWHRVADSLASGRMLQEPRRTERAAWWAHVADSLQRGLDERLRGDLHIHAAMPEEVRAALTGSQALITLSSAPDQPCAWVQTRDTLTLVNLGASSVGISLRSDRGPAESAALRVGGMLGSGIHQAVVSSDRKMLTVALAVAGGELSQIGAMECGWAPSAGTWLAARNRPADRGRTVLDIRPSPRNADDPPSPIQPPTTGSARAPIIILRRPEGPPVMAAATAQAWLAYGARTAAIQVRGGPGAATDSWIAQFQRALQTGSSPAHAALAASQSLRAAGIPATADSFPAFAIYGDAFRTGPARRSQFLEPWVVALASGTALLALLYFGFTASRPPE